MIVWATEVCVHRCWVAHITPCFGILTRASFIMPRWSDPSQLESGKGSVVQGGSFIAGQGNDRVVLRTRTEGFSESIGFIIGLSWSSRGFVEAPFGLQRNCDLLGLRELESAGLLRDNGALVLRLQSGNKLGDISAGLLWVQVTDFLRNINKRSEHFVMTLFISICEDTSSSTDLNRKFLTGSVSDKLARLLLNIFGGAGRLIHSATLLWSLSIALFD